MDVETTLVNGIAVVTLPQRFDTDSAPPAEPALRAFAISAPAKKLVIDFSRTDYVASAGLKVILLVTKEVMKSGGRVELAGIRPPVMRIFEMAGFTSIFSISGSREEAIRKVS